MSYPVELHLLAGALRSGRLALDDYLDRLEAHFEQREPQVHAFLAEPGRFDRLRREAAALQARFPEPQARPPLFGIPVGVKDIFHVEGMVTRGGSKLPPETLTGPEAASVNRLRRAGALILGKTVTTEFAFFAPGPTRNPHHLDHTPGGSSSGSAAAVGAGLCPLAVGTQTIGSVVRPAAFCGVVGYKPSYDRISREGVIPLSPSLDHVGVFTPDVAGMMIGAAVLCADWQPRAMQRRPVLGVPQGPYFQAVTPQGMDHFQQSEARLEAAGYQVKTVSAMADFSDIVERHYLILAAEAASVHETWYAEHGHLYHSRTSELVERGRAQLADSWQEALAGRAQLRRELAALMEQHGLDLWIAPSAPGAAPGGLESTGDPIMNLPWTHSGLPSLNLPSGINKEGLPLGLQVVGKWYEDEKLLGWAEGIIADC